MPDTAGAPAAMKMRRGRRQAMGVARSLVALLLLTAALAACKEVTPGSGVETIRNQNHHDGGPGGR